MSLGRILDIFTDARRDRRLYMRNDCDGSQYCVVELHIEDTKLPHMHHMEVHLTPNEVGQLRDALDNALKAYEERNGA